MEYREENERLKDQTRCASIRADLKICLLNTDCCKIQKRTPKDCLQSRDVSVPEKCYNLWQIFFDCKHSIIDGKRRFRGPRGYN